MYQIDYLSMVNLSGECKDQSADCSYYSLYFCKKFKEVVTMCPESCGECDRSGYLSICVSVYLCVSVCHCVCVSLYLCVCVCICICICRYQCISVSV